MYNSNISPLANQDIREAAIWYNKQQPGLGKRFTTEVRKKIHLIRQNPTIYNIRYDNVRTAVLNIFPYMIHYAIDEENKAIFVIGIFHTSQSPENWNLR